MIRHLVGLVAICSSGIPPALVGQSRSEEVSQYLTAEMAKRAIPGLAVAVVRGGRVEKVGSYGKASLEFDRPVTDQTLFQINSTTKSFTGVAVMILVEAGAFTLDDPIGSRLEGLPAAWHAVTIRQLMNHTSGLPDIIDSPMTGNLLARNGPDALKLLAAKPMMFPTGTSWSYNQTNYLLLAMLIEKASGLPFDRFCLERQFAPLGITSARFGDARAVIPGRATGYTKYSFATGKPVVLDPVQLSWYEFEPFLYTGAGLNISAADFGAWIAALLGGKLISRASLETLWTPTRLADGKVFHLGDSPMAYGLGWPLMDRPKHRAAGGSGGVRAGFFIYPDDDLAVVVLTNLMGAQPEELIEGVAALYLPDLAR